MGASVERRVWTDFAELRLYPNLFVFLVGPPGTGKSVAMRPLSSILRKSGAVTLAPNDITKQGLLDCLFLAARGAVINGRPFDYHYLAIRISELSNFMSQYDGALAGLLTELYDCEDMNDEKKRGHDKGKSIPFPGISLLVGTATQNLGNTINEALWGSGFMARVIMVYSADKVIPQNMFRKRDPKSDLANELVVRFDALGKLAGPMTWEEDAQILLYQFRLNAEHDAPLHNRLVHYTTRRWMHLAKLCMIAALNDERMTVTSEDFDLALEWLMSAEAQMTEVFKDMVVHTDGQIHEQMRSDFFAYHMTARSPVTTEMMVAYLKNKAASHLIPKIIEIAVASGAFRRVAGTTDEFLPQGPRTGKNLDIM